MRIDSVYYIYMSRLFIVLSLLIVFPLTAFKPVVNEPASEIDIVLCVDLSSSTNGLLEIIRQNIWKILSDFTYYKPVPKVRFGFVAFGRPSYGKENKYISIVSDLTYNYDQLVQKIFDIKSVVAKGDCYISDVVNSVTRNIHWSSEESTLKLIYIIGNGSPFIGYADMESVCETSRKRGIVINPVYYKSYISVAEEKKWFDFAESCGSNLSIVSLLQPYVFLKKEYDNKVIFSSNTVLNNAYVYYGKDGKTCQQYQIALDQFAADAGENEMEARIIFKASELYLNSNESWDLVDLTNKDGVDFLKMDKQFLPDDIKDYESAKLEAYLLGKKKERSDAIALIKIINQNRIDYLKALKKETEEKIKVDNSLQGIITKTNSELSKEWGFSRIY